jgi:hypothetical protein
MKGGSKKLLLIIRGEGFRSGGRFSRKNGLEESYKAQEDACKTHMDLVRKIESKGYTVDILLNTYHTKYDDKLKEYYGNKLKHANFHEKKLDGQYQMMKNCVQSYEGLHTHYDAIIISRLDMHLKQQLIDEYDPSVNTVQFLYLLPTEVLRTLHGNLMLNDIFIHFPHRFFDKLKAIKEDPRAEEGFKEHFHNYLDIIPLKYGTEYSLLADTFHSADPSNGWNPYYTLIGRESVETWEDKGKKITDLPDFKDQAK